MRKIFPRTFGVLCLLAASLPAFAAGPQPPPDPQQQFYPKDQSIIWNRAVSGGDGLLYGVHPFDRNMAPKSWIIKEIGWMTLKPGDSIGVHKHENNENAYIILSGQGTFIDTNGKEIPVKAGDTTIARTGQSHGLKNTGTEPLLFMDVIGER